MDQEYRDVGTERRVINSSSLGEPALYSGDPWQPSNEYFDRAEAHMEILWSDQIWPFIKGCDFSFTVDLAAGKGRNSVKLIELCQALFVMDIDKSLVDHCRERLSGRPNITYAIGNGYDVTLVPDSWATLVYCFDAMVHFDSDVVRSYLSDLRRALRPGGRAFLHHSNLTSETSDWRTNTCARNFMSLELLANYARKEGLSIVAQESVAWVATRSWMAFRYLKIHCELARLSASLGRMTKVQFEC